jgi:hypothetical protein
MFYAGYTADLQALVPAIGYATSEDGFHWTKYESNPVFLPDESIAPYGVWNAFVILDGETWVMYFNPIIGPSSPSREILRATAPAPTGPWTVEPEAVLETSTARDWDYGCPEVDTVLRTDDGYCCTNTPAYILVSPSYGVAYIEHRWRYWLGTPLSTHSLIVKYDESGHHRSSIFPKRSCISAECRLLTTWDWRHRRAGQSLRSVMMVGRCSIYGG